MFRFDPFSPAIDVDPFDDYRTLRDEYPCFWSEEADMWVLSRYEDVIAALHDHETFSSAHGNMMTEASMKKLVDAGAFLSIQASASQSPSPPWFSADQKAKHKGNATMDNPRYQSRCRTAKTTCGIWSTKQEVFVGQHCCCSTKEYPSHCNA